ncbi:unnamed protein product [Clonostachys chloroleuca]|uniref:UmuC domain-containing protein n=1 Tax=Clonostachys chloroleuca TaxID=1926264 RepID=A0AA35QAK4_9HYPO|nr:unnamed protein product [Clonostachys chloroleuca]
MARPPRKLSRKEDRIILQFDYDCFYAQVYEVKNPALKPKPLGIKQKNILATCNYNARRRGVKKLMLITEAKKICPELVIVEGEDLTPFRDVSKILFNFFKSYSWNQKVERLGFDEVFMDVTDIINYNMACFNKHSPTNHFFQLSEKDPELGFVCDLTSIPGATIGGNMDLLPDLDNPLYLRLVLGSHLAHHLRLKVEQDFGYTSTCGISTNKLLSKLAGSKHKPQNQTTLLALTEEGILEFMSGHFLRSIPGIGFKSSSLIEAHVTGLETTTDSHSFESRVTAAQALASPHVSPASLETLLAGPGAEKGIGSRIWGLLHGVDPTEVKEASDIPSQISIEDTFGRLETMAQILPELYKLSCSLVRRMRVDLLVTDGNSDTPDALKWLARPKTLRLSVRSWPKSGSLYAQFNRQSRSGPLPSFALDGKQDIEAVADRLVSEALLPLLRKLQEDRKGQPWSLQLINICVSNLVPTATEDKSGVGRDIANMFRRQDEVLAPWRILPSPEEIESHASEDSDSEEAAEPETWETTENIPCDKCGHAIPYFALEAHFRYHQLEED